jgi:hypothetical protein
MKISMLIFIIPMYYENKHALIRKKILEFEKITTFCGNLHEFSNNAKNFRNWM